jgi:hypothetical protein
MKFALFILLSFASIAFGQTKAIDQKKCLQQYIGIWYSTDQITDKKIGTKPKIKMIVKPKLNHNSLVVEVFERHKNAWKTIMQEMISYDALTDQIVALGQDRQYNCFIGRGQFVNNTHWQMIDTNFKNDTTQTVFFHFLNEKEVVLKGVLPKNAGGWEIKYIKL